MPTWKFSIGNLAHRAPLDAVAVSPAVADALYPLSNLANGYPDQRATFEWRSDGAYKADLDLNLLAATSSRTDAPSGWRDLLLALANTPGLSANPPDWGTYAARDSLRLFRPVFQDVEVMPGEDVKLDIGLHLPAASAATSIRVRVIDLWSGKGWNGSAWASDGVLDSQAVDDTWKDVAEVVTADATRLSRSVYRVIVEPVGTFGATTYVYASATGGSGSPALYAKADIAALIGHNLATASTVSFGSESLTIAPLTCYAEFTSKFLQTWRLDVAMPAGNQPRPLIGEVWIGQTRTFLKNPQPGIQIEEGDPNQIRVESTQGRIEIISDQTVPAQSLKFKVKVATDTTFEQYRSELMRGSRFGAEPMLLIPADHFDGAGRVIHGRIGNTTSYTVEAPGWRAFAVEFAESPMAGA